jgi:hypothetical protein
MMLLTQEIDILRQQVNKELHLEQVLKTTHLNGQVQLTQPTKDHKLETINTSVPVHQQSNNSLFNNKLHNPEGEAHMEEHHKLSSWKDSERRWHKEVQEVS